MPEGDTVYRTAKNLDAALRGDTLTRCEIRVPAFATMDLTGDTVEGVASRGKHLLIRVGEHSIHSHLKMEGSWHLYRHGSKWRRPAWQARAILGTDDWVAVGFEFGVLDVVARDDESSVVGYLGPDLLGPDWDQGEALLRLTADPGRAVGLALLDQRVMAGLGNVYRNELCFLRGILPTRPVGGVDQPERLVELAHRLIDANKDRVQRTTTGSLRGETAWVYRREGRPCLRCGTRIEHGELGDTALELRDAYWCPRCQS
ncbi:DNA-formamidopyrimidine glycosylase family protein [Lacisediminihabitans profunda]|uniref:DNA-(apurinic or apyrimidinic site) lyase n=1 Tax=Lacisediminihabitans profunda TaxID=2594790 RepID=A0A5C8UQW7_9MICO|nr:DNA-formamidopyrimidine glycosylase family protein [Lacisediminihabitans profunda]TXN30330.1 Fpg/Nei family DNA glycosylase [Lacisediminihabitans profunda]